METDIIVRGVGGYIRELREQKSSLPLNEFARSVGLDPSELSRFETNKVGLSAGKLSDIAVGLGMKPRELVLLCLERIDLKGKDRPRSKSK